MSGRRIFLVRAVNVGGAKLPMADWRVLAEELGATDVSTYIASGNLVCTPPSDVDAFERALEVAVQERFGFFREVISRSVEEVRAALDAHPFEVLEPRFSYVTFLAAEPTPDAIAKARIFETGEDRWEVIGRELHVRYAGGAGRPQMKDASIGRALAVPGTARNLNTVRKLLELAG
ncbi:uncharacterized protein (DUF1697 family) [Salana multivorans]|uniref:Uncharacterized protein (DUF1697 family) n=1 Tax=Salana multivorans TaxID=120377 RepID=A0A3N2D7P9_9MICO|nr:DUF1697 domain-containing protein [Salana multivorans]ROR95809.1 uncharacterized protein (DUF1697 family) [Salana multivorans]